MTEHILTVTIAAESDVVKSRQLAREVAAICGFGAQDQARIATAVTEMARNVYSYAQRGAILFAIDNAGLQPMLEVLIEDQGPGIADLDIVLAGQHRNLTGPGLGIPGTRRLVDRFELRSAPGAGTSVTLQKFLPREIPLRDTAEVMRALAGLRVRFDVQTEMNSLSEVQQQNRELLATLAELKMRQEEQLLLTRELEDTNRGVVALYAELDEKARRLRHADETKSRFLSNMSHEFRTPLSSIRALSRLLLDHADGELNAEQGKQVRFILSASESLAEMVNDLLDLAKIESGKVDIRNEWFSVREMFSALRGMLRPLLMSDRVLLSFDLPEDDIMILSDEGKISQILRNFISNALKFTEAGSVTVRARCLAGMDEVCFSVTDTGLGIAEQDQQRIFEEFGQVENRLQHRIKGTGLGLPLCRNLATLLKGKVTLESVVGEGSIFSVIIPCQNRKAGATDNHHSNAEATDRPATPMNTANAPTDTTRGSI